MQPTTEAERLADDALDRLAGHITIDAAKQRLLPHELRQYLAGRAGNAAANFGPHDTRTVGYEGLRYAYDAMRTSFIAEEILYSCTNVPTLVDVLMEGEILAIGTPGAQLNRLGSRLFDVLTLATLAMGGAPR